MQILSTILTLTTTLLLAHRSQAQDDVENQTEEFSIVGTWASKSNTVFTGPGFYDPIDELLIEPALPGISYSFTEDGHFEEAIYKVVGNPRDHSCPVAVLTFQHGDYEVLDNGTIVLTPIKVDGRQLVSEPCEDHGISSYIRYNQTEIMKSYYIVVDPYHGRYKLQLFEWDGTPVQPLYLAYRPPLMLPTQTLNPTDDSGSTASETGSAEASGTSKVKRSLRKRIRRSLENQGRTRAVKVSSFNYDLWWWVSVGMIVVGSGSYLLS